MNEAISNAVADTVLRTLMQNCKKWFLGCFGVNATENTDNPEPSDERNNKRS